MRRTISQDIIISGIGLHSGARVSTRLIPHDSGMVITRHGKKMRASWDNVRPSKLCTLIVSPDDPSFSVSTTEHIMAALWGAGITDVLIEVSGPEIPILDGSALPFMQAISDVGTSEINGNRDVMVINQPVFYRDGDAYAALLPADKFEAEFHVDFSHHLISQQSFSMNGVSFMNDLAPARTFCMEADVKRMRASGLALGGTKENAVVFSDDRVITPGGLRFSDEPVRHKLLDAIGDLHLAGVDIIGRFVGHKSGHLMTNMLLRKAFVNDQEILRA